MVEKEYQYDYLQVQLGGLFGQIYCSNDLSLVQLKSHSLVSYYVSYYGALEIEVNMTPSLLRGSHGLVGEMGTQIIVVESCCYSITGIHAEHSGSIKKGHPFNLSSQRMLPRGDDTQSDYQGPENVCLMKEPQG